MISAFRELGDQTAANWEKFGGDVEAFPEVATSTFTQSRILETVEVDEIAEWLASSDTLPTQYGKEFGQPPINVYVAEKFYIQVLFWVDGTTSIHEHGFAGAFGVLAGSSVHTLYKFQMRKAVSPEIRVGNVNFISSELLRKGDIRTIHPGSNFIHALFHLDRPSVSVVIRAQSLPGVVQYAYVKPHVAVDPFFEDRDTNVNIKLRLLESLRVSRSESFWRYAGLLLASEKPATAFKVLMYAYQASRENPSQWEKLLEHAAVKYGIDVVEDYAASIKEDERSRKLTRLRSYVGQRDYRFFLALLLNVPDRATLMNLISLEYKTKEPELLLARWVREMATERMFVIKFEPPLLDVLDLVAQYGSYEKARAAMLRDGNAENFRAFDAEQMEKLWNVARDLPFFHPLFADSSGMAASVSSTNQLAHNAT